MSPCTCTLRRFPSSPLLPTPSPLTLFLAVPTPKKSKMQKIFAFPSSTTSASNTNASKTTPLSAPTANKTLTRTPLHTAPTVPPPPQPNPRTHTAPLQAQLPPPTPLLRARAQTTQPNMPSTMALLPPAVPQAQRGQQVQILTQRGEDTRTMWRIITPTCSNSSRRRLPRDRLLLPLAEMEVRTKLRHHRRRVGAHLEREAGVGDTTPCHLLRACEGRGVSSGRRKRKSENSRSTLWNMRWRTTSMEGEKINAVALPTSQMNGCKSLAMSPPVSKKKLRARWSADCVYLPVMGAANVKNKMVCSLSVSCIR